MRASSPFAAEGRRRGTLVLAALSVTLACWGCPASAAAVLWQPDVRAAIAYAHTRAGEEIAPC